MLPIVVVIVSGVRIIGRSVEWGGYVLAGVDFVFDFVIFAGVMMGSVRVKVESVGVSSIFDALIVGGVEQGG